MLLNPEICITFTLLRGKFLGKILNCFKVHYHFSSWVRECIHTKLKMEETNEPNPNGYIFSDRHFKDRD